MNLLLFMDEDCFQRVVYKAGVFLSIVKWISCSATKGHFLCTLYPLSTLNNCFAPISHCIYTCPTTLLLGFFTFQPWAICFQCLIRAKEVLHFLYAYNVGSAV